MIFHFLKHQNMISYFFLFLELLSYIQAIQKKFATSIKKSSGIFFNFFSKISYDIFTPPNYNFNYLTFSSLTNIHHF